MPVCLPLPSVAARSRAAAPLEPCLAGVNQCSVPEALRVCSDLAADFEAFVATAAAAAVVTAEEFVTVWLAPSEAAWPDALDCGEWCMSGTPWFVATETPPPAPTAIRAA